MYWFNELLSKKPPVWKTPVYELHAKSGSAYLECWIQQRNEYTLHIKTMDGYQMTTVVNANAIEPLIEVLTELKDALHEHRGEVDMDIQEEYAISVAATDVTSVSEHRPCVPEPCNQANSKEQPPILVPPNIKSADHHWLEKFDSDGHSGGLIVAQWNPGAQRWSHSGSVGTGLYLDTTHWKYAAKCPLPDTAETRPMLSISFVTVSGQAVTLHNLPFDPTNYMTVQVPPIDQATPVTDLRIQLQVTDVNQLTEDALRKHFESFYLAGSVLTCKRNEQGEYCVKTIDDTWVGWKLAANFYLKSSSAGYKPTPEQCHKSLQDWVD